MTAKRNIPILEEVLRTRYRDEEDNNERPDTSGNSHLNCPQLVGMPVGTTVPEHAIASGATPQVGTVVSVASSGVPGVGTNGVAQGMPVQGAEPVRTGPKTVD
eukprot:TRINITY_DN60008_c0_g1_i1.p1 TRINITY_DN60008_c0_g1~~TRINITY_DN60008_c0_g1_i1.p1  ORF type:complete len:111 (-),score=20.04 TRINITY_DN60008_c0_g1_i1:27-335(-)